MGAVAEAAAAAEVAAGREVAINPPRVEIRMIPTAVMTAVAITITRQSGCRNFLLQPERRGKPRLFLFIRARPAVVFKEPELCALYPSTTHVFPNNTGNHRINKLSR